MKFLEVTGILALVSLTLALPAYAEQADWSGFYVGGGITASSGADIPDGGLTLVVDGVTTHNSMGADGISGFALAGYARQTGNLVIGVEADYALGAALEFGPEFLPFGNTTTCDWPNSCAEFSTISTLTPLGHIRATLGYGVSAKTLIFATAGAAFADIDFRGYHAIAGSSSGTTSVDSDQFQHSQGTAMGVTLGVGAQTYLGDKLLLRGEIIHDDYGIFGTQPIPLNLSIDGNTVTFDVVDGMNFSTTSARISLIYKF